MPSPGLLSREGGIRREVSAVAQMPFFGSGTAQRPSFSSSSSSLGPAAGVCWAATCGGVAHPQLNLGLGDGDGKSSP